MKNDEFAFFNQQLAAKAGHECRVWRLAEYIPTSFLSIKCKISARQFPNLLCRKPASSNVADCNRGRFLGSARVSRAVFGVSPNTFQPDTYPNHSRPSFPSFSSVRTISVNQRSLAVKNLLFQIIDP
jgi:hypothetical protein